MGLFEDLSGKYDELKQLVQAEHDEIAAAIAAMQGNVNTDTTLNLTADQKAQLDTHFAELKDSIPHIFDQPSPTPTPTPTPPPPDVTPPPAPTA